MSFYKGAKCKVSLKNNLNFPFDCYISFGQFLEDSNTDEFGINDDDIFYYAFGGLEELKTLKNPENDTDFIVNSYILVS
jgi:hypothetical protein